MCLEQDRSCADLRVSLKLVTTKKRRMALAFALVGLVWFGYWRGYICPTTGTAKSNKLSFGLALRNGPDKRELRMSFDRTKGTVVVTRTATKEMLVFDGATVQSIVGNVATVLTSAPVQASGLETLRTIVNVPGHMCREVARSELGVLILFLDIAPDALLCSTRNRMSGAVTVDRDLDLNASERPKETVIDSETRPSSAFFTDRIAAR